MNDLERIIDKVLAWLSSFFGVKTAQQYYQVIDVNIPTAAAADSLNEVPITLNQAYNKIIGIAYHEITAGGQSNNYNVGARSKRFTWVELVNINNWNANTGVGPMHKFRKVNIGYGEGDKFFAQISPNALTTSAITGQMVLILERDLTELPSQ